MVRQLVVIAGPDEGRSFPLPEEGSCTIGSSQIHSDIRLHDPETGRAHCEVRVDGDDVVVTDLASPSGTFVNSEQVTFHELHPGDVLRLGSTDLRLEEEEVFEDLEVVEDPASHPYETLAGRTLAYYEVGELLGRGHCGAVFKARAVKVNQMVALKVLHPSFPADDNEMQRFIQALKPVLPLRHPNLVTLFGLGRKLPYCWLSLEYVEGDSLATLIELRGGAPAPDWRIGFRVALDVGRGLECAHGQRVIHGNVTPANVLLGADRRAKLGDLMLAKALAGTELEAEVTEAKRSAEMAYRAPEQTRAVSRDPRSDLYGLGAVVYALLAGRPPFAAETFIELVKKVHTEEPPALRKVLPNLPEPFEGVVRRLMAKRPEERFQSASELVAELQRVGAALKKG